MIEVVEFVGDPEAYTEEFNDNWEFLWVWAVDLMEATQLSPPVYTDYFGNDLDTDDFGNPLWTYYTDDVAEINNEFYK